jgi:two-component system cell cycle sensor histidine kinase/response regulator CckA
MEKSLDRDKTILVVDDSPDVLDAVSGYLGRLYNVLKAPNGVGALRQSKDFKAEIHLLLSDFQMPGITGVELATRITLQRPNIKVLLMSGFTGGMLVLNEGWHFLPKPFIPSQLRALVATLLVPEKPSRFKATQPKLLTLPSTRSRKPRLG